MTLADPTPVAVAVALTGVVAVGAWRAGSLSGSGAGAALLIGVCALTTAWGWGLYLILWFASASLLSRLGRARKAARTAGIVAKGDRRDAGQVLANGAVFAVGAFVVGRWPALHAVLAPAAAGALAAAGADTWATEIGTLVGGQPWSLRLRRRVTPGTSGAVTVAGSLAAGVGALALAAVAVWCRVVPDVTLLAVAIGGIIGSWTDTVLGAWWQLRRRCAVCGVETEQDVHDCGTRTDRVGGISVLDNDGVNLWCTVVGALVAGGMAWSPLA